MTNNRAPKLVIVKMMFDGRKPGDLRSASVNIWDHRSIGIWDHRSIREDVLGLRDAPLRESDTSRSCSALPTRTRKLRGTCVEAVLIGMDQLLLLLLLLPPSCASANVTLTQDECPSTSGVTMVLPSRWKAFAAFLGVYRGRRLHRPAGSQRCGVKGWRFNQWRGKGCGRRAYYSRSSR